MDVILQNAVSITILLGFVWGIFSFSILRPLNKAIDNLNKAIGDLRMDLLTAENRRHELEVKVTEIDQRSKDDSWRISRLEAKYDELEHR